MPWPLVSRLVMLAVLFLSAPAAAELSLNPRRVVFEDGDRSASLTLMNRGTQAETYRLYWVYRRMGVDLAVLSADSEDDVATPSPENFIRYAPRQVTLEPGQTQTVRLLLRRPAGMAVGEYRAHLMFEREPETITSLAGGDNAIQIRINVAYGISIPVIVRHGTGESQVTFSSVELQRSGDKAWLNLDISRQGDNSIFGRLTVVHTLDGKETVLTHIPNFAVYSEVDEARARIDLRVKEPLAQGGIVRIELRDRDRSGEPVLAEATINLGS